MSTFHRREFLSSVLLVPAAIGSSPANVAENLKTSRLKVSLNAFSFNDALLAGEMDVFELMQFCADTGFDAVDITGYYLKGYPVIPGDEYLFRVKRKALELGLEISGTGVRNDFTIADKDKRKQEVQLVKDWVHVAVKIGAPVIRIFAGNQKNDVPRDEVTKWMIEDIRECVEYGAKHGVVIGLQNHADFIQTAEQVNAIIEAVNSEWLGLILDTGSYRVNDAYLEIERSIKHAVNWQIKEKIFINGAEIDTDLDRIVRIIRSSNYNGYLPIETLGKGDPRVKVPLLYNKLKTALGRSR